MNNQPYEQNRNEFNPYLIAFIMNLVCTIILGVMIIPLAWGIPMTIATKKAMDEYGTPNEIRHDALGILSILFLSFIAGICILIAQPSINSQISRQNSTRHYQNENQD
ncbi:hypothetical protein [[Acholeplasma] multilocale]|uniref:hypothetical protein n=1 Tax=[Acholeplasma] multilocale TaxID=264638 RepID=UPI000479E30A|nr:hypothetical protein [[Acholeplasma] multilocale]